MAYTTCPQAPSARRFRVKTTFRNEISNRFGAVYASSVLSRRGSDDKDALFAPVAIGPGDVAVFTWPAIRVDESWLDPV